MAGFTKLTQNISYISQLPDKPRLENGYSAAEVKSTFDRAAGDIKNFINTSLIPELESTSGASKIGVGSTVTEAFDAADVDGALCAIKELCDTLDEKIDDEVSGVALGDIPDGSLTEEKLSEELYEKLNAASQTLLHFIRFDTPGNHTFTVPKTGLYDVYVQGAGGSGTMITSVLGSDGSYECSGGPSGAFARLMIPMTKDDVCTITVGTGGVSDAEEAFPSGEDIDESDYRTYSSSRQNHCVPGGQTSFTLNEKSVVCPGGTRSAYTNMPQIHNDFSTYVITRESGKYSEFRSAPAFTSGSADSDAMRGCSSFFGTGGSFDGSVSPSPGSGGSGGRIRYQHLSQILQAERYPGSGGDGIAAIIYVG